MQNTTSAVACIALLLLCACSNQSTESSEPSPSPQEPTAEEIPDPLRSELDNWTAPECGEGMMAIPGEEACQPIGSPCPDARWPELSGDETSVYYIEPGSSGDGSSPDTPMGSINAAIALADPGSTMVLGAGTFTESIQLPSNIHLKGLCSTKTILSVASSNEPVVLVTGQDSTITDVTLRDGQPTVEVNPSASISIIGSTIKDSKNAALVINNEAKASVVQTSIHSTDAFSATAEQNEGTAIVNRGVELNLDRVSIESSAGSALFNEGAQVDMSQVYLRNNGGKAQEGFTIESVSSPLLTIQNSVLEESHGAGIGSFVGGRLSLSNSIIRKGLKQGLITSAMEETQLEQVSISHNKNIGWVIIGRDMQVRASHVFVEHTAPDETEEVGCNESSQNTNQSPGYGVVQFSGSLELKHFEISHNASAGLVLFDSSDQSGFMEIFRGVPNLQASHGTITQNLIGVNIQIENFDLDSAFNDVRNFENEAQDLSMENLSLPSYSQLLEGDEENGGLPNNDPVVVDVCPEELICLGLGGPDMGLCTTQTGELPATAPTCRCSAFCGCEQPCPSGMDCIDMGDSGPFDQANGTCATMCFNPIEGGPGGPGGPSGENPWSQYGACDPAFICNPFSDIEQFACTTRCGGSLPGALPCTTDGDCPNEEICLPELGTCAPMCDPETQYPAFQPDSNGCIEMFQNDGGCDEFQNNAQCNWDGGDCCESTCVDCISQCGAYGYNCLDPNAQ